MATIRTAISKDYKLQLVSFPTTRRYEVQGLDLENDRWVINMRLKVDGYDHYRAVGCFNKELRAMEMDGVVFHTIY